MELRAQFRYTKMRNPAKGSLVTDDIEVVPYSTGDGVQASMSVFQARSASAPVIVCLPAMGVRGSYYSSLARAFAGNDVHAVTGDLRGVGTSSVRASRRCDFGYNEILTHDLPELIGQAKNRFPESKVWLLGHSLGGQLGALHLGQYPENAEGLVLVASGSMHYKGWPVPTRWGVLAFSLLLRSVGRLLGHVPAGRFGFAGNEARTVIVDWSNNCMNGRYAVKNSAHDYELSLHQMTKPVLSVSFEADSLVPRSAVVNLLSKLPGCAVSETHYSSEHPGLENANHFDWARRPGAVAEHICAWMRDGGHG